MPDAMHAGWIKKKINIISLLIFDIKISDSFLICNMSCRSGCQYGAASSEYRWLGSSTWQSRRSGEGFDAKTGWAGRYFRQVSLIYIDFNQMSILITCSPCKAGNYIKNSEIKLAFLQLAVLILYHVFYSEIELAHLTFEIKCYVPTVYRL